jgi:hypothetical protein
MRSAFRYNISHVIAGQTDFSVTLKPPPLVPNDMSVLVADCENSSGERLFCIGFYQRIQNKRRVVYPKAWIHDCKNYASSCKVESDISPGSIPKPRKIETFPLPKNYEECLPPMSVSNDRHSVLPTAFLEKLDDSHELHFPQKLVYHNFRT